jgi:hypothetical protein
MGLFRDNRLVGGEVGLTFGAVGYDKVNGFGWIEFDVGRKSRAAHTGNAGVPDPLEGLFLRTGKGIKRSHQLRIVLIRPLFRLDNDAQAFGIIRLQPRLDFLYRAGNGRVYRNRHGAGRGAFGYALAPPDPVAGGNKAFVWRTEMLINGNDNLFGKGSKLHGLSLGSVFPGV